MKKELRQSPENARSLADVRSALAACMAELHELRETVLKAERASVRAKAKAAPVRRRPSNSDRIRRQ